MKQDTKLFLPYDPVIFLLGVQPKEITPESHKDFHIKVFNAVLFIRVKKKGNHLKCPVMGDSLNGKFA